MKNQLERKNAERNKNRGLLFGRMNLKDVVQLTAFSLVVIQVTILILSLIVY